MHDPLMRGEVVNKASARLGVSPADFGTLLSTKPRGIASSETPSSARAQAAPAPRHDIAMLCLLALRDEAARNFLLAQNWRETLEQVPDAEILIRILQSELHPDDPASLSAFMASLSPAEEALVSAWLLQKVPADAETMVEKWWLGIRHAVLRRRLAAAQNRIKLPELSTGEIVNLQKQILDLQEQLHELSAARRRDRQLGVDQLPRGRSNVLVKSLTALSWPGIRNEGEAGDNRRRNGLIEGIVAAA